MEIKELISYTKQLNVLFVEDDISARKEISLVLERFFKQIFLAEDGEEGLAKFKHNDIDLIITDINMPRLNGLEMIARIKQIDPNINSIILSAYNETEYFMDAILYGVNGFLLKPFILDQFIKTLQIVYKDIELKKEIKEVKNILSQYQDIVDKSLMVCKIDLNKKIIYRNEKFKKIFDEISFEKIFYNENLDNIYKIIDNKETFSGILRLKQNEKIVYTKVIIKPILNNEQEIIEYIAMFLDVDDVLSSKQLLLDYIEYTKEVFVGILCIKDFKDLRNYFGYKIAKDILFTLENKIKQNLPSCIEAVYNLKDGKFVFVTNLERFDRDNVIKDLKEYQQEINKLEVEVDDFSHTISTLLSVSSGENVLETAEMGLEEATCQNEIFIDANNLAIAIKEKAHKNLEVLKLLKTSIENKNLTCYYQPIIDNKTKKITKYEALIRIETENKVYLPYEFLDIAKHSEYYSKITYCILNKALNVIRKENIKVSVNISQKDITKPKIINAIYELLEENKDITHLLTFEILEDENIDNIFELEQFLKKAKELNIVIAIDDFGSGYSNFKRILIMKPDILKIDGSLIQNIDTDKYSYNLVKSIIEFAKINDIKTVAEFVENEVIYNIVKDLGIDCSQGYYFAKPTKLFE